MSLFCPINLKKTVPNVVATLHTWRGIEEAGHRGGETADLLEFRADLLLEQIRGATLRPFPLPVILTVRAVEEGGKAPENLQERKDIYSSLLKIAHLIDVELLFALQLESVIQEAREAERKVILSFHDFTGTPSIDTLRTKIDQAATLGADLCKIATTTETGRDLSTLLSLLEHDSPLPLALMGMGKYGKISRPLLAQAGSRLNYGYLDQPLVPGQWPAAELKRLIQQLES